MYSTYFIKLSLAATNGGRPTSLTQHLRFGKNYRLEANNIVLRKRKAPTAPFEEFVMREKNRGGAIGKHANLVQLASKI